jgi:hypothetical protein
VIHVIILIVMIMKYELFNSIRFPLYNIYIYHTNHINQMKITVQTIASAAQPL